MANEVKVLNQQALEKLCRAIKGVANVGEKIDDNNIATDSTYSSFKIEKELEGLETELYDYMNTALAGLNKLTKEIIDDVALVVKDNVLYLYKDPDDTENTYMQMMLINGIAVELGTTEVNLDEYVTKTELESELGTETLDTTSQTVKGAINELFTSVTNVEECLDEIAKTYTSLTELGLTADATFQDVVDALPEGGSILIGVKEFTNYKTIFPYEEENDQFARVHIVKGVAGGSCMYARWFRKDGAKEAIANFNINDNKFNGWQKIQMGNTKTTLVADTTTLKLDITKKNSAWYGAIKLTYLYATSPVEIEITFNTDEVRWAVISGKKSVNNITFTQDSSNTAHYTIGIRFSGKAFGCYQAEVIGGFANINELTKEAFTGEKTAVYYSPWGKNNGVTLVGAPEDIGLTFPCTTVQLAQAMRDKFNNTIKTGAIGVFDNGGKATAITDAPSTYGLLHIETFGHDKMLIRYDGVRTSTHAGSWIGQIKGNDGIFSDITWCRIDNESRISELEADVDELFQSVSDGKTLVANAITDRGISTAADATFATMATNISKISGCKEETKSYNNTSSGTALITLTFSANVLGVKQIKPPTYSSRISTQTSGEVVTFSGKELTFYVTGAGTWEVTAIIK